MNRMRKPLITLISMVIMLSSTIIAVLIVQSLVPKDHDLSRTELPDGSVRFTLESLRESVSWPIGATAFVVSGLTLPYFQRRLFYEAPAEKRHPHIVSRVLNYVLMAFLLYLLAKVILLDPMFNFRTLTLKSDMVLMSSLYHTWSIPLTEISDTHIERKNSSRRGNECTDFQYEVRGDDGSLHHSILVTCRRPSNELSRYTTFLDSMDAELKNRLKKQRSSPSVNADK